MDYQENDNSGIVPTKENVCAVVVTYFPDHSFVERVKAIRDLVDFLIIVDNSDGDHLCPILAELSSLSMINIIQNKTNLGVATALNLGVREVKQKQHRWVFLLDQDSYPMPSIINTFSSIYKGFSDKGQLVIIGSKFIDYGNSIPLKDSNKWERKTSVITSGSLILRSIFDDIGYFRDELFIDQVDHEYCLRARKSGYEVVQTQYPVMKHSIGSYTLHKLIWRMFRASNHSASRHYYMVRNYIFIFREYIFSFPSFITFLFYVRIRELLLVILFEEKKLIKLKAMAIGFWHGCCGRFGKLNCSLDE